MRHTTLALIAVLAIGGCKKKPPVEDPIDDEPAIVEEADAGDEAEVEAPPQVVEMISNFERVHFELDSHELAEDAKAALLANAEIMQTHTDIRVEIQGHADERGTTEYNLALGERRAESVKKYLALHGVSGDRISTVSYGEERPIASGSNQVAWSKNRRAEFRITWSGGTEIEGTTE